MNDNENSFSDDFASSIKRAIREMKILFRRTAIDTNWNFLFGWVVSIDHRKEKSGNAMSEPTIFGAITENSLLENPRQARKYLISPEWKNFILEKENETRIGRAWS